MVHVKVKGAAAQIDSKDVSPAWKVLQMKLKEQESEIVLPKEGPSVRNSDKASSLWKAPSQYTGSFPRAGPHLVNGPNVCMFKATVPKSKSRKRRLQEAFEGAQKEDEPAAKREHDVPVLIHDRTTGEATHVIALDCEYVGGGTDGRDDLLARVSIVNEEGKIVYDKYVKPRERVTDFRTSVSGIRPENIAKGLPFDVVQMEVAKILKDRVVAGHALNNDFRVLNFHHNSKLTRDTARCHLLRKMANCNGVPSLKKLANAVLGIDIQQGEHDSVIDARVALRLYLAVKKKWESDIKRFRR